MPIDGQMMKGKDRRQQRAAGSKLTPLLKIGRPGLTDNILKEIATAFKTADLLKITLVALKGADRKNFAAELAIATKSELVQVLGSSVLIYKV
jgi:RNA-binding protein